jgi:hypothetical protein
MRRLPAITLGLAASLGVTFAPGTAGAQQDERAEACRLKAMERCDHLSGDPAAYQSCAETVFRICMDS